MTTKTIHAPKVRNALAEIIGALPSGGLTTAKLIDALKTRHSDAISAETAALNDIAFARIIAQISERHSNATPNVMPDLFGKYGIQPMLFVTVNRRLKNISDTTLGDVDGYVSGHSKPRSRVSNKVKELARLAKDAKASGAKSGDTIGTWWALQAKQSG